MWLLPSRDVIGLGNIIGKQVKTKPFVFYSAIRLWSEDLKHLIPKPENPEYRVSIYL